MVAQAPGRIRACQGRQQTGLAGDNMRPVPQGFSYSPDDFIDPLKALETAGIVAVHLNQVTHPGHDDAGVRTGCPLLGDEAAAAVLPSHGIQVPPGSAWLPIGVHLPRFADDKG